MTNDGVQPPASALREAVLPERFAAASRCGRIAPKCGCGKALAARVSRVRHQRPSSRSQVPASQRHCRHNPVFIEDVAVPGLLALQCIGPVAPLFDKACQNHEKQRHGRASIRAEPASYVPRRTGRKAKEETQA